jgi:hypothetical protein
MKDLIRVGEQHQDTSFSELSNRLLADSGAYSCPLSPPVETLKTGGMALFDAGLGYLAGSVAGYPRLFVALAFATGLYFSIKGEQAASIYCSNQTQEH